MGNRRQHTGSKYTGQDVNFLVLVVEHTRKYLVQLNGHVNKTVNGQRVTPKIFFKCVFFLSVFSFLCCSFSIMMVKLN